MPTLTFDQEHTYLDPLIRVSLELLGGPLVYSVSAILDTGAFMSVFPGFIAASIGIPDITTGTLQPLTAANGGTGIGYIHPVRMNLWGRETTVPIAFADGWPNCLLGMGGFFDQFRFGLDHAGRRYYISL